MFQALTQAVRATGTDASRGTHANVVPVSRVVFRWAFFTCSVSKGEGGGGGVCGAETHCGGSVAAYIVSESMS